MHRTEPFGWRGLFEASSTLQWRVRYQAENDILRRLLTRLPLGSDALLIARCCVCAMQHINTGKGTARSRGTVKLKARIVGKHYLSMTNK